MFSGPIRGGTRGGQGDFKWTDVADDKDRENYLGHSILAPVGRWQKNRDITWYNNDKQNQGIKSEEDQIEEKRKRKEEEIKAIKLAEEDALSLALGFKPTPRAQIASSSNTTELGDRKKETNEEEKRQEKEKRAKEKAEKLARKLARAEKRAIKHERHSTSKSHLRHSRSPIRRREDYDHEPIRDSRIGSRRRERSRSFERERDSSNRYDKGKRREEYRSRSRSKSPSISTSRHQYHHRSPSPDSFHRPRRHRSRSIEDDRNLTNSRDRTRR